MANLDELHIGGLRIEGNKHAREYALFVFVAGVVLAIAMVIVGALLAVPAASGVAAVLFFAFGFLAVAVGMSEYSKSGGRVERVVNAGVDLLHAEIDSKYATPPAPLELPATLPALPPENKDITVRAGSREVVLPALVNGFDPRDLDWFAQYLANKNKWTETALEKMPLPYSGELIGKEGENTIYHRLMSLCVERGIITGRGGPGNPTGKLTVSDAKEIAKFLKQDNGQSA